MAAIHRNNKESGNHNDALSPPCCARSGHNVQERPRLFFVGSASGVKLGLVQLERFIYAPAEDTQFVIAGSI